MDVRLDKVLLEEKDILYRLLQFALYDGSKYTDNDIDSNGIFSYKWFDNYFTDENRFSYFIRSNDDIIGIVMINKHMKVFKDGHSVAEFLVLPKYRKHHIGSKVAYMVFDMFPGNWEVEPIEKSEEACIFWKKVIEKYTNGDFTFVDNIYTFKN